MVRDVVDWLDEHMRTLEPLWATRLPCIGSGCPDEGTVFVPRQVMLRVTPRLFSSGMINPSAPIEVTIDSHPNSQTIEVIRLNSGERDGNPDETRLRSFDASSVLGDPESTGALVMFAFQRAARRRPASAHVWMCETASEEDRVEDRLGPADPHFGGVFWPHFFERLDWPYRSYD